MSATRSSPTDLSVNYTLPFKVLGPKAEFFFRFVIDNLFNADAIDGPNGTVLTNATDTTLQPFNPFTTTPVENVHYRLGPGLRQGDFGVGVPDAARVLLQRRVPVLMARTELSALKPNGAPGPASGAPPGPRSVSTLEDSPHDTHTPRGVRWPASSRSSPCWRMRASSRPQAPATAYDVVIRNGRVLDGDGTPWFRADVGVRGDRIVAVGDLRATPGDHRDRCLGSLCRARVHRHAHARGPRARDAAHWAPPSRCSPRASRPCS